MTLTPQQRAVYQAIVHGQRSTGPQHFPLLDAQGHLQGPFGLMVEVPDIGGPLQELGAALRYHTALTAREREIAILTVARCTASDFERHAHEAVGRAIGLTDTELTALHEGTFTTPDPREQAIATLSAQLTTHPLTTPADLPATDILDRASVIEVTTLAGYYRTLSQLMGIFGIGAPELRD
ncbi:carboxymuconolactone decarboxylase family protein [Nocardia sp. NPDC056000]|uniref:carboxymuconolactone decarboxylase family protein n=1 Tax=Nocardia sp. NPDC056000 TaxID=3345674 RepID=UPI0035DA55BD